MNQAGLQARVPMRLGVAMGLISADPHSFTPALARRLAGVGLSTLITHIPLDPGRLSISEARRIRAVLADEGIGIAQAGGFRTNLVDPDDDRRRAGVERLREVLAVAKELGAEQFVTGCGSHHPEFYGPHPLNHTDTARDRLVESLRAVAPWAEGEGILFSIEGFGLTTLDNPTHVREILDRVDSPWVRETFDPVNMIGSLADAYDTAGAMRKMWNTIGGRYAPCAHAKDIVVDSGATLHLSQAPPGQGLLDYGTFFDVCKRIGPNTAVVVEHLDEARAIQAIEYVRSTGEENGVVWE